MSSKNIHIKIHIETLFIDNDAKKKFDQKRCLYRDKLEMPPGGDLTKFMQSVHSTVASRRDKAEAATSHITEMRERVATLSTDLMRAGFHDAAKDMQRMSTRLIPSDEEMDDELEDDDDDC